MADWSLLTNHAWVLLCIAHDPGVRLRDIAAWGEYRGCRGRYPCRNGQPRRLAGAL